MNLYEQLKQDRTHAFKQGNRFERDTLTVFIGDLQSQEKRGNEINDPFVVQSLKKAVQTAEENFKLTNDEKFEQEAEIYRQYLPTQMSEQTLTSIIEQIIEQSDNPNIGVVMKELKANYDGRYDGKTASTIAKQLLN